MIEPQPSLHVLGLRIDEPITVLTDLLVSGVCLYAFFSLSKHGARSKTLLYFRFYFLLMSVATLFGGLFGHAFLYALRLEWKLIGWIISMLSIALIERSAIEYVRPLVKKQTGNFFSVLNILELFTIMTITISTLNFKWVEFHSGYGLLGVVLPFHLFNYYKTKDRSSLFMIVAVFIASMAALIFMNKISIHTWFNYLDVSHVLMAIASFVFYKGALLLHKYERIS